MAQERTDRDYAIRSNIGLGLEIGSAALAYGIGWGKHNYYILLKGLLEKWRFSNRYPTLLVYFENLLQFR
jgi:hypothetical protein